VGSNAPLVENEAAAWLLAHRTLSRLAKQRADADATFVDLHHIQPRSQGGRHDASNFITLCGAHHRAAHRGELLIDGNTSTSVRFRHADGSEYVLAQLHQEERHHEASAARLLREAIIRLTAARVQR
jgi:HNH endonuclease